MFDTIVEAIGLIGEGAQDGLGVFSSFTSAGTSLAKTYTEAITGIKNALVTAVQFIGKLVAKFQG